MSDSKRKLNQEEYEKLIGILSKRKQSKEQEISLRTVILALEELDLLDELQQDDIRAIQGQASQDLNFKPKHQSGDIFGKAIPFLSLALLAAVIYLGTQWFPGISHSIWQTLMSVIANTEEATKTNNTPLNPGEAITEQGFRIVLENPSFVNLPDDDYLMTFEMLISNNSGGQLVTQITGENISVVAGNGKTYPEINFWRYQDQYNSYDYEGSINRQLDIYSLAPGETKQLQFGVVGNLQQEVNQMTVQIKDAGRIKNAQWQVQIPR